MKPLLPLLLMSVPLGLRAQFIPNGPDAPEVDLTWSSGYHIELSNPPGSNNSDPVYYEYNPDLAGTPDAFWRFQGYLIFQVVPDFVPYSDNLFDPQRSRLVASSDIEDGLSVFTGASHVVMHDSLGAVLLDTCYVESVTVDDAGIQLNYTITTDAFTEEIFEEGDPACFVAVAFATNPYQFENACEVADAMLISTRSSTGAVRPYCAGSGFDGVTDLSSSAVILLDRSDPHVLLVRCDRPLQAVRLIDAQGRVVRAERPQGETASFPLDALAPGCYTVALLDAANRSGCARFVVTH